jgi:hypothetical protein
LGLLQQLLGWEEELGVLMHAGPLHKYQYKR